MPSRSIERFGLTLLLSLWLTSAAFAESIKILEDAGKEIVSFSDEDRARLTEAGQPYLDEWVARADAAGLDGQALLDEYRGLIAQYTQELETQGYPWERG